MRRITTQQQEVLYALFRYGSIQEVAKAYRVKRLTILRWMQQASFNEALTELEEDLRDSASRKLLGLAGKAINAIEEIMDDSDPRDSERLKAAQTILYNALRTGIAPVLEMKDHESK